MVEHLTILRRGEEVLSSHGVEFTAKNIAEDPVALVECPNCAGGALWVKEERAGWLPTLADRVSCPECDKAITLPRGTKAGDAIAGD